MWKPISRIIFLVKYSTLGIAGTVIFLLFGICGLIFYIWYISTWGHDSFDFLLPWAIIFTIIGIVIGIADGKLKKKSN